MTRASNPIPPRQRRIVGWTAALLALAGFAYVVTLPMRQSGFAVRDHALVRDGEAVAVEGILENRGAAAPAVLVEAYLYDADGVYITTVQRTVPDVAAAARIRFQLPLDPGAAARVERYTVYAGVEPNPFAPDGS